MKRSTAILLIIAAFLTGAFLSWPRQTAQPFRSRSVEFQPLEKSMKRAAQGESWGKWWI